MNRPDVAVIGAGMMGVCTALELAQRGCRVALFDKEPGPMTQASIAGEGKLHCGFLYAKDPTLRTAAMMRRGALSFPSLIAKWTGGPIPDSAWSRPFRYAVHRRSLLGPEQVEEHFRRVAAAFAGDGSRPGASYPGHRAGPLYRTVPRRERAAAYSDDIVAAYQTIERAVNPEHVVALLRAALFADSRISFHPAHLVDRVEGESERFEVIVAEERHGPFHHVVNASWAGRLALDEGRGLVPNRPWLFRYKVGIDIETAADVEDAPSTTIVLGPFGDVVNRGGGHWYLSWYPVCYLESGDQVVLRRRTTAADEAACVEPTLSGLESLVPAVGKLRSADRIRVKGGMIFSWGDGDIHQNETELHQRFDIGPASFGNYHTVDTGKLTTAPLFAREVAARVAPER